MAIPGPGGTSFRWWWQTRSASNRRELSLKALAALGSLLLVAMLPGEASARPGTPNGGFTGFCGSLLHEAPIMCVGFRNTATEPVGFLLDWTGNGQPQPNDLSGRAQCLSNSAQMYECSALQKWFSGNSRVDGPSSTRWIRDREHPQGFRVTNLAYDTEYCFRFRAVDDDGVISGSWSGYTCARTPPEPQKPAPPPRPKLTPLAGSDGKGEIGGGKPFRMLVEWDARANETAVGWYSIERWSDRAWSPHPGRYRPDGTNEAAVDLPGGAADNRYTFRVCAENIVHKSCSPDAGTLGRLPMGRESTTAEQSTGLERPRLPGVSDRTTIGGRSMPRVAPGTTAMKVGPVVAATAQALAADPLSAALRDQQLEGANRRGFDIGMAAAGADTQWGPGAQAILDSLAPAEQEGFKVAVSFALDRNRNKELAEIGARIADADVDLTPARKDEWDARYWLGFDIATGLFGDPALGARGHTALGPDFVAIRDGLSAPAQRGFNAGMTLHLGRRY